MRNTVFTVLVVGIGFLSGCAINPTAPIVVPPIAEPASPQSHVVATLTTSWPDLIAKVDTLIPKCGGAHPEQNCEGTELSGNYLLQRDGAWEQIGWGFGWEGAIWRYDALSADIPAPRQFAASLNLLYHVRGGLNSNPLAGCGYNEPPRTATMSVTGSIEYSPDWHVVTSLNPTILFTSSCNVAVHNLNVSDLMASVINPKLHALANPISDKIATATNVKPQMSAQWAKLQQPISLGNNAWLVLAPTTPTMGSLTLSSNKSTLSLPMALEASPQIVLGDKPEVLVIPLPSLATGNINPQFQVNLRGIVSFAEASKLLKDAMAGQSFSIGENFPQSLFHFSITDVRVSGNGREVTVALVIEGSAHGTLYLTGLPIFRPEVPPGQGGTIVIEDIKYTAETNQVLVQLGDFIFHNHIEKLLQDKAKWDVSPQLADIRQRLITAINRPMSDKVDLHGTLAESGLGDIWVSERGMEAWARANGTLAIDFHNF